MEGLLIYKRFFTCLFLFILLLSVLNGEEKNKNRQRIIPLDSPLYEEIDRLYLLNGLALPSTARPWSEQEALLNLKKLPLTKLSEQESESFKIIDMELSDDIDGGERGGLAYRISGEINIEGYLKGNEDREEWEHGYEGRKPLLTVPLEGWFSENLYSTIDLTLKEEYRAVTEVDNNNTNIPSSLTQLDWYFPFRSFISFGGESWNIQAGRDNADWGMGQTGNLLLSDYSDFYNIIRFTTFWEKFKYTAVYIGLDSWLTDEEKEIDETENGLAGGYYNFKEQYKALLAHRLEFRTTEQLNISFNESIIFGNKYINITELNPVFVFHNLFSPEYSNAMISMEADYTPIKGLNIYLQYALDEFQIPGYEDEDTRPAADGVMTGFRYIEPVKSGYLTFSGEFALTDPYLYNRWHPLTRFTNRRRIWSNIEPDGYEYINKPIGYQYGPDAIIFYAKIGYSVSALYSADIDARYSIKGELNDSLDDPQSYETGEDANSLSAGSGITENELVVGFHSTVFPLSRFSLSADLYWIDIANYNHASGKSVNDLELAVSGKIRF